MLNEIKQDAQQRMAKSVDALKHELQRLRTGRASTALVEHLDGRLEILEWAKLRSWSVVERRAGGGNFEPVGEQAAA